jgi:hypothetical protein
MKYSQGLELDGCKSYAYSLRLGLGLFLLISYSKVLDKMQQSSGLSL